MLRTMCVLVTVANAAAAFELCGNHRSRGMDPSDECIDLVSLFMQDVLDAPEQSAGRRLLPVKGGAITVPGDTVGQQIAFLVDLAVHGKRNSSGWELPSPRRLYSKAAENFANLVDNMADVNNEGCRQEKLAKRNAQNAAFKKASTSLSKAMGDIKHATKDDNDAIVLERIAVPQSNNLRAKLYMFLTVRVKHVLLHNHGILTKAKAEIDSYKVPVVRSMRFINEPQPFKKYENNMAAYEKRNVEAAAAASNLRPIFPKVKMFSLMAAGMIAMYASLAAGFRQWNRWRASASSEDTREGCIDVE